MIYKVVELTCRLHSEYTSHVWVLGTAAELALRHSVQSGQLMRRSLSYLG